MNTLDSKIETIIARIVQHSDYTKDDLVGLELESGIEELIRTFEADVKLSLVGVSSIELTSDKISFVLNGLIDAETMCGFFIQDDILVGEYTDDGFNLKLNPELSEYAKKARATLVTTTAFYEVCGHGVTYA